MIIMIRRLLLLLLGTALWHLIMLPGTAPIMLVVPQGLDIIRIVRDTKGTLSLFNEFTIVFTY